MCGVRGRVFRINAAPARIPLITRRRRGARPARRAPRVPPALNAYGRAPRHAPRTPRSPLAGERRVLNTVFPVFDRPTSRLVPSSRPAPAPARAAVGPGWVPPRTDRRHARSAGPRATRHPPDGPGRRRTARTACVTAGVARRDARRRTRVAAREPRIGDPASLIYAWSLLYSITSTITRR